MLDEIWHDADGTQFYLSDVYEKLALLMKEYENTSDKYQLIIGSDSDVQKFHVKFVTAICLWKIGKGAVYFYKKWYVPKNIFKKKNDYKRIYDEVEASVQLANHMFDTVGCLPTVHLDVSPKENNEFTSAISDQLKGYVKSLGFDVVIKPMSFCASSIGDRHSK